MINEKHQPVKRKGGLVQRTVWEPPEVLVPSECGEYAVRIVQNFADGEPEVSLLTFCGATLQYADRPHPSVMPVGYVPMALVQRAMIEWAAL